MRTKTDRRRQDAGHFISVKVEEKEGWSQQRQDYRPRRSFVEVSLGNGRRIKVGEDIDLQRLQALIVTVESA